MKCGECGHERHAESYCKCGCEPDLGTGSGRTNDEKIRASLEADGFRFDEDGEMTHNPEQPESMPETTEHGYPIIQGRPAHPTGWHVIVRLNHNKYTPYVVWWMNEQGGCRAGDYSKTYEEAVRAWSARA